MKSNTYPATIVTKQLQLKAVRLLEDSYASLNNSPRTYPIPRSQVPAQLRPEARAALSENWRERVKRRQRCPRFSEGFRNPPRRTGFTLPVPWNNGNTRSGRRIALLHAAQPQPGSSYNSAEVLKVTIASRHCHKVGIGRKLV